MSNYTPTTDFSVKDGLSTGNAAKLVKGVDFDGEFDAIQTAVNSKANSASPTFSGTATLPTVDIGAGAIDGTAIGASSASTGAFTTLTAATSITGTLATAAQANVTSLGTIASLVATTADINAGTVDATIGATTPAAGTFTSLTTTGAFTSLGIDDNADAITITIDSDENVGIGTTSPSVASGGGLVIYDNSVARVSLRNSTTGDGSADGVGLFLSGTTLGIENREGGDIIFYTPSEVMRIADDGNVGIGTSAPTELLDVAGDSIRIRTAQTPASATATGTVGQIAWDASYIYVCISTDVWKRSAISTW